MFKLALCQMKVCINKEENLNKAEAMIRESAQNGANIIALPEMFNCPYSNDFFREYAEEGGGISTQRLSSLAKELGVYIVGGTIPENDHNRIYNTCYFFGKDGALLGKHRKVHLFDIDVKGGICFKESDVLTSGDELTIVETEYGKVGIAICYDIRFPELTRLLALEGARLVILPGAFNMTTGPAHWHLSIRARALDNQIYFAAVSPAREVDSVYVAYGNSCIANPWGQISAQIDENEGIVYGNIDFEFEDSIREQLPLLKHRRTDLYKLEMR